MTEREPETYWPGYVDVLSNMVLALIYVVMVLSISLSIQSTRSAQKIARDLKAAPAVPPAVAPAAAPAVPVTDVPAAARPDPPAPAVAAAAPQPAPVLAPALAPADPPEVPRPPAPDTPPPDERIDLVVTELAALVAGLRADAGADPRAPAVDPAPAPPTLDAALAAVRELRMLLAAPALQVVPAAPDLAEPVPAPEPPEPPAATAATATAAPARPAATATPADRIEVGAGDPAVALAEDVRVLPMADSAIVILFPNSIVALDGSAAGALADRIAARGPAAMLSVDMRVYSPKPYLTVERVASVTRAASVLQALVALGVPETAIRMRIVEDARSDAMGEVHLALSGPEPE